LAQIESIGGFSNAAGDRVVFWTGDSLAGATPNGPFPTTDSFMATRGPNAWATEWVTDAPDAEPGTIGSRTILSTEDGARQIMQTENSVDPADTFAHSLDAYLRTSANKTWLTPGARAGIASRFARAASTDLQTVLIQTEAQMLPADTDTRVDFYFVRGSDVELVTPGTNGTIAPSLVVAGPLAIPGTMAPDGSWAHFVAREQLLPADTDTQNDVYRYYQGGTLELISASQRTLAPGTQSATSFIGAAADGGRVCFETATALLDDDSDTRVDVYCLTRAGNVLERASQGLNDNDANAARGLAVSADGSTVVFATATALTASDGDGGDSLYARRGGQTVYVSPLVASDSSEARRVASAVASRTAHMTPDGGTLVFVTSANAVPADTDGSPDVYRWKDGTGLELISAGGSGGWSATGSYVSAAETVDVFGNNPVTGRVLSASGDRVFFDSTDSLAPGDTDGGSTDVYEWQEGEGLSLISPPSGASANARYLDSSADGSTVFFTTSEDALPQDVNGGVRDVYASRTGNVFPVPSPGGEGVGGAPGDAGPAGPTAPPAPGTVEPSTQEPPRVLPPPPSGEPEEEQSVGVALRGERLRADGREVRLRLVVPGPGTLRVAIAHRRTGQRLGGARHEFDEAGQGVLELKLSRRTAERLQRKAVPARVVLTFTSSEGERVRSVARVQLRAQDEGDRR
jgi:hypothetical protein